jgi:hypothetical protein
MVYDIKFFEGALKWQQNFLLRPWMAANRKRCQERYGKLTALKKEYYKRLAQAAGSGKAERSDALDKVVGLRLQIQAENDRLEQIGPMPSLPCRLERVRPMALGNTFALMEEYPYDRYGIDAVAIWSRLHPLLPDAVKTDIGNQKLLLDFMLNLARAPMRLALIGVGVRALVVAWLLYRAAVGVTATMGLFVTSAFDFYRGAVLEKFGLSQPSEVEDEQFLWLQLASFLRRGDGFKLPPRRATPAPEKK